MKTPLENGKAKLRTLGTTDLHFLLWIIFRTELTIVTIPYSISNMHVEAHSSKKTGLPNSKVGC